MNLQPSRFLAHLSDWFALVLLPTVLLPIVLLTPSSPAFAQATATQIALTSQEQTALRQGRILLSGEDGNYTARVMVNGSAETAWAVLTDYNNFANFFPSVESSQLLSSDRNQKVFEQVNVVRIFPITRRARVVIAASETYPSNIAFQLVEGDLEGLQGSWYVTGAGNQVMITHQVIVDPGSSNRSLFFSIYKDNLQKTMAALKQEIERRSGR